MDTDNILNNWIFDHFIVSSLFDDISLINDHHFVSKVKKLDGVSDENSSLILDQTLEDIFKY
jgi:hypothetical protein